jgi:hypothetical protein
MRESNPPAEVKSERNPIGGISMILLGVLMILGAAGVLASASQADAEPGRGGGALMLLGLGGIVFVLVGIGWLRRF